MTKTPMLLAAASLAMMTACGAEGSADAASGASAATAQRAALSAEQAALLPPMKRHETDFVTIDLPQGATFEDESFLGSIGLYGGGETLSFEVFTASADSVEAYLEKEASHPTGLFQSFGWEERGREALGGGVLFTGMGGGTSSQPNRPIALYIGPGGKDGLVELTVKTEFGTDAAPDAVYALAKAMAISMVVDDLPDENSYAAFRSSRFGEVADVPYEDGRVDTERLAPLTVATMAAASEGAAAFSDAFEVAVREDWSPDRVRSDLIPLAQRTATDHRAMMAYAEAWNGVVPKGDPGAPAMRALGLVGKTGYSFLWNLAGHVTRVAELQEKDRTDELAAFRAESTKTLEAERDLYAYAMAAYAAAKADGAVPAAPGFADAEVRATALRIEGAAKDMKLAVSDPTALRRKYAAVDKPIVTADAAKERRLRAVRAHMARMGNSALGSNHAGLDPFSNVTAVRVYGGMGLDPWD